MTEQQDYLFRFQQYNFVASSSEEASSEESSSEKKLSSFDLQSIKKSKLLVEKLKNDDTECR